MQEEKTHVYLMPGMAASKAIFEYINLPCDQFELHYLEWIIPYKKEALTSYAKRMSELVQHQNPVLLGVSFGGILVQEMNKYISVKKTVVVSSVLNEKDYPFRMKFAKLSKVYKLAPTRMFSDVEKLAKYAFGVTIKERIELYKKYLSVNDKKYLDWALEEIINWKQTQKLDNVIHIHGTNDRVFPFKNIKGDFIAVKNGTHVMIINKYKWFNENLPKLLIA
ncbi:alpha/beta hydrolase [Pseudofulvibacter geojedonensis]|uniref:Alpha/beta hydrolase n=1 Tax=Pseudofulvibacter geojedonensis TaxID=1123758 RepID=A0ABW3HZD5_9FLAO